MPAGGGVAIYIDRLTPCEVNLDAGNCLVTGEDRQRCPLQQREGAVEELASR